jgi:hypothetical protein
MCQPVDRVEPGVSVCVLSSSGRIYCIARWVSCCMGSAGAEGREGETGDLFRPVWALPGGCTAPRYQ